MSFSKRILPPIPEGFQILWNEVELMFDFSNREPVQRFIQGSGEKIELESESSNPFDRNAIAVYGIYSGFFSKKREKIGYLPKTISAAIIENGLLKDILPRLKNFYIGDTGYCAVLFDLLGPKAKAKDFVQFEAKKKIEQATKSQEIKIPRCNVEKNILGMAFEKTGEIEKALICYEACIKSGFDGSHPYNRLLAIYAKLKRKNDEIRVAKKAVKVFEKINSNNGPDVSKKLENFKKRLSKLEKICKN